VRLYEIHRDEDATGISGTGIVAEAAVFSDGITVVRWLTARRSTAIYLSLDEATAIHGHGGLTRFVLVFDLTMRMKLDELLAALKGETD